MGESCAFRRFLRIFGFLSLTLLCSCQAQGELAPRNRANMMVTVPAGWFTMGQNEGPRANRPSHEVYLDTFAIDRTEVTNAAFARFVGETGQRPPGWDETLLETHANHPVVGVRWLEADAFCRWTGNRLPTEAEWEKAARGTDGRRYPWGNDWLDGRANTAESGHDGVLPVGAFPDGASPYGVLDMAGNAAEWVADYFAFDYYQQSPTRNPQGPEEVMDHGLRGGSWASPAAQTQTFFRDSSHSASPNLRVGFRCAKTVEATRALDIRIIMMLRNKVQTKPGSRISPHFEPQARNPSAPNQPGRCGSGHAIFLHRRRDSSLCSE